MLRIIYYYYLRIYGEGREIRWKFILCNVCISFKIGLIRIDRIFGGNLVYVSGIFNLDSGIFWKEIFGVFWWFDKNFIKDNYRFIFRCKERKL